jgi:hypothetical protein
MPGRPGGTGLHPGHCRGDHRAGMDDGSVLQPEGIKCKYDINDNRLHPVTQLPYISIRKGGNRLIRISMDIQAGSSGPYVSHYR